MCHKSIVQFPPFSDEGSVSDKEPVPVTFFNLKRLSFWQKSSTKLTGVNFATHFMTRDGYKKLDEFVVEHKDNYVQVIGQPGIGSYILFTTVGYR